MTDFKVSHRYATSLLEDSVEKNKLETITADMILLSNTLKDNTKLQLALESPVIKPEVKSSILNEIFKDVFDEDTFKFVDFVIKKKRESLLCTIASRFLALRDEYLGETQVSVKTVYEFSEEQKRTLTEYLEKTLDKKVRLTFTIDEDLIGGFVAKAGDTLFDASLQHQLGLLKNQLLYGSISKN
jgi:F-type H+-transporting ATPase subunit delta